MSYQRTGMGRLTLPHGPCDAIEGGGFLAKWTKSCIETGPRTGTCIGLEQALELGERGERGGIPPDCVQMETVGDTVHFCCPRRGIMTAEEVEARRIARMPEHLQPSFPWGTTLLGLGFAGIVGYLVYDRFFGGSS